MLNLLPMPNGILNLAAGQQWTSNSAYDNTPEHSRTNNVVRIDQVFTPKTRASFKLLKDRDDVWSYNNFTPGTGHVANNAPGIVASGTVTQVLRPNMVNEINFGYTHNRWGFYAGPEDRGRQGLRLHVAVRREPRDQRAAARSRSATTRIRRSSPDSADRRWTSGRMRPVFTDVAAATAPVLPAT